MTRHLLAGLLALSGCLFIPGRVNAHLDSGDDKPATVGRFPVPDLDGEVEGFELVAHLPIPHGTDEVNSDVWRLGDLAFVGYRCNGSGSAVVDISDPSAPTITARTPPFPTLFANDVKALALAGPEFSGDVFIEPHDNCGSTSTPARVRFWDVSEPTSPMLLSELITYSGVHNAYPYVRDGRAYLLMALPRGDTASQGVGAGFAIADFTDPTDPEVVGTYNLRRDLGDVPGTDFLHDVWADPSGDVAYLSWWDAGLILLDISNPSRPERTDVISYYGRREWYGWAVGNTHAAVPSADGRFVIVTDEDFTAGPGDPWGFTRVIELDTGRGPSLTSVITTTNTERFPAQDRGWYSVHNPHMDADMLYLSHYSDGVRAVDLSDPASPVEVARFVPPDLPDRRGRPLKTLVWGVFAQDGLVLASDVSHGLWILRHPAAEPDLPTPTDVPTDPSATAEPGTTEPGTAEPGTHEPTQPPSPDATPSGPTPTGSATVAPSLTATSSPSATAPGTSLPPPPTVPGGSATPTATPMPPSATPSLSPTAESTGSGVDPTGSPTARHTSTPSSTHTPPPTATPVHTPSLTPTDGPSQTPRAPDPPTQPLPDSDCPCRVWLPIVLTANFESGPDSVDAPVESQPQSQSESESESQSQSQSESQSESIRSRAHMQPSHRRPNAAPGDLIVDGDVVLSGERVARLVYIKSGGVLRVGPYDGSEGSGHLTLVADEIVVDAGGTISAAGAGFRGRVEGSGEGPGGGQGGISRWLDIPVGTGPVPVPVPAHFTGAGAGAGHGGAGGDGLSDGERGLWAGGPTYGSPFQLTLGSAGGAPPPSHHETQSLAGAHGGGALALRARHVRIDGGVTADGDPGGQGEFDAAGGGAGGTVVIDAERLELAGTLSAKGGAGGEGFEVGGAGGGGRISIRYRYGSVRLDRIDVSAGRGPCPGDVASPNGCPGEVVVDRLPVPVLLPRLSSGCDAPSRLDLVFVVDVSQSMTGAGRQAANEALATVGAALEADAAAVGGTRPALGRAGHRFWLMPFDAQPHHLQGPFSTTQGATQAYGAVDGGSGSRLDRALTALAGLELPGPHSAALVISDGRLAGATDEDVRRGADSLARAGFDWGVLAVGPDPNLDTLRGAGGRLLLDPALAANLVGDWVAGLPCPG